MMNLYEYLLESIKISNNDRMFLTFLFILFIIYVFYCFYEELKHPHVHRKNWNKEEWGEHLKKYHPEIYEKLWKKDEGEKNG